ncbi:MAG TPA: Uma2 family endonuclease [Gemmataceae bacterium]|jgi:Uma2 family endonuclease|nr:Uma2 family endonuclease [Gemmataceae bacterium]
MIATQERAEQRFLLSSVSWHGYETLLREIGDRHLRITFDNGDLELMTPSFRRENAGEWIGRLIFFLALEWNLPICSGGSTTLKQAVRQKGLEPDKCFWIEHEKDVRGKKEWDATTDPPPDLAVEVDITRSSLDRMGIYATLGVPEIWRYDGETFEVLALSAAGNYVKKAKSRAFRSLPVKELAEFVVRLGADDEVRQIRSFVEWARTHKPKA